MTDGHDSRAPAGGREPYSPTHVYTDEESEFLAAMEAYKKRHKVKFPPWTAALKVLKELGYVRGKTNEPEN